MFVWLRLTTEEVGDEEHEPVGVGEDADGEGSLAAEVPEQELGADVDAEVLEHAVGSGPLNGQQEWWQQGQISTQAAAILESNKGHCNQRC